MPLSTAKQPGTQATLQCTRRLLLPSAPLRLPFTASPCTRYASAARPTRVHTRQVLARVQGLDLDALGLDIPDIDGDIRSIQESKGAVLDANGVAASFNNSREVLEALQRGVVLVDRSHWGRIRVAGDGRISFMHNQSTNDFQSLAPGQGCETVFVTATARTLDLATAYVMGSQVLVVVSPSMAGPLLQRMDKYIFPGDNVQVMDVTSRTAMLTIAGPSSDTVLQALAGAGASVMGQPHGSFQMLGYKNGTPVIIAAGSGLSLPGYTLIMDESVAGEVYSALADMGCVLMGNDDWERARILLGRPAVGAELTEDYNPLEAGLFSAVSVKKGCYIGQETLSKLSNNNGVKQQLWGVQLSQLCQPGAKVMSDGQVVGKVTSVTTTPDDEMYALAYIKSKSRGAQMTLEGLQVSVDGSPAEVVRIPYATRSFPDQQEQPAAAASAAAADEAGGMSERAQQAKEAQQAAAAAAEQAKQERLQVSSRGSLDSYDGDGDGGEADAWQQQQQQQREPNKWRLIVDRQLPPYRKARVVDIEAAQAHGRPEYL